MSNPYMPLFVSDYLGDTSHLTTIEHGAYMLLLMSYWQSGKPLPAARLATIARLSPEQWAAIEPTLAEFFERDGISWRHARVDFELSRVADRSSKARASVNARIAKAHRSIIDRSTDDHLPNPKKEDSNPTTSEQEAAPAKIEDLGSIGTGRGGGVSVDARRQVARDLNLADATPLAEHFERWQKRKPCTGRAKSPDALFVASAKKLLANAPQAIRDACRPLAQPPPDIAVAPRKIAPAPHLAVALNRRFVQ